MRSRDLRIQRLESRLGEVSGSLLEARELVLGYINNRRSLNDLAVWVIEVQDVLAPPCDDDSRIDRMLRAARNGGTVGHQDVEDISSWD